MTDPRDRHPLGKGLHHKNWCAIPKLGTKNGAKCNCGLTEATERDLDRKPTPDPGSDGTGEDQTATG